MRVRSPPGTPAPAPTCCAWRSRRGTPPTREQPSPPAPPVTLDLADGRARRLGGATTAARPSLDRLAAAASRRGRCGRRCPGADWPTALAHAAAATLRRGPRRAALRARPPRRGPGRRRADRGARRRAARRAHRRPRPGRALPRLPGRLRAARCGSWSAPGPRPSPRCATSAWSRSGTTATTCTPSRGRRTRTPARCCCCAPTRRAAAALVGGFARTVEARVPGRAPAGPAPLAADRATRPRAARRGSASPAPPTASSSATRARAAARLPRAAYDAIRDGLEPGPVLRADAARTATPPRWPATPAARRPGARRCTGPLRLPGARTQPPTLPLVRRRAQPAGRARSAAAAACARRCSATGAPPRSSAAPSRSVPVRTLGRRPGARRGRRPSPRSWWPRPGPSRSPRAATPAWCCSTPG